MQIKFLIISILFVLSNINMLAQADTTALPGNKPKIGLVLSGGGAKGMAHVGVLKVIEEIGIRPDYITGTSMGSIVGGLFAIGYSASEIEQILLSQNWNDLMSNDIKLSDISINEKDQHGQYIVQFPIQGTEISLPRGLNFGQKIMRLLNYYTLPAHNIHNFDSLPIPFKCIGADITNADILVLDTGSLAIAMRASMSIPTVFTPVLWGDRLLVDGGMSRNFPVQEAKEMGADIIIGSYTGGMLKDKDQINSMLDIMGQAAFFMGIIDAQVQKKMVDVYIEPNLSVFSPADFTKVDTIIHCGENAARLAYFQLDSIANLVGKDQSSHEIEKLHMPDSLVVQKVVTRGIDKKFEEFVIARMGIFPNKKFHVDELEMGITRVYGSRYFYRAHYGFERDRDGNKVLVIYGEMKPIGFLGASVHYDSEKRAALLLNATFRDLLIPATRLSLTANISENPGFQIDYYKYFGNRRQYVAGMHFNNDAFDVPVYLMGSLNRLYKFNYISYGIFGRYALDNDTRTSLGGLVERTSIKPKVHNTVDFEKWTVKNYQVFASFEINNADARYFPNKGLDLEIKYEYNFDLKYDITLQDTISNFDNSKMFNETFGSLKVHVDYYKPIWKKLHAHIYSHNGLTFGENFTLVKEYKAGGIFTAYSYLIPFEGFNELEYSALQLISGGGGLRYEIFPEVFIEPKANVMISANYIADFFKPLLKEKLILGYGLQIGYSSLIGPVIINVSSNTYNKKVRTFFNIGYRFRF